VWVLCVIAFVVVDLGARGSSLEMREASPKEGSSPKVLSREDVGHPDELSNKEKQLVLSLLLGKM